MYITLMYVYFSCFCLFFKAKQKVDPASLSLFGGDQYTPLAKLVATPIHKSNFFTAIHITFKSIDKWLNWISTNNGIVRKKYRYHS